MISVFCVFLGVACGALPDTPPSTGAPTIETPVIAAQGVHTGDMAAPAVSSGRFFSANCDVQPPDDLARMFWGAARRYPAGFDECRLARQSWHESRWKSDAVSPVGAIGVSQFLPGTAGDLGVDPWDPASSIDGQARYIVWCKRQWTPPHFAGRMDSDVNAFTLGCYNWGLGSMLKSQERHGWAVWDQARDIVPKETRDYVHRIEGI